MVKRTGGLRKGRVAKDRTDKSGGYRVFSFFADRADPVFLLWILDKFADKLRVPVATVRDWEQHRRLPTRRRGPCWGW